MALDRPLVGEPLSLDLLDTTWMDRGSIQDLLEDHEVLSWGHTRPVVGRDGPGSVSTVDDRNRRAGWLAAVSYVELLTDDPSRIRRCAHPECVLYFYDTSPKRSRRWCSMAGCGNRAKAARHYARSRR